MEYDAPYWNVVWNRKYERYNRHHADIWKAMEVHIKGKVVDLGIGPGVIYEGKDIDLTGVDISEEALNQARLHFPSGNYVCASAVETGLPRNTFDTILMLGLLDYFDDWNPILAEARRIGKEDAKIIGTLLHGFGGHNWEKYPRVTGNWHIFVCAASQVQQDGKM